MKKRGKETKLSIAFFALALFLISIVLISISSATLQSRQTERALTGTNWKATNINWQQHAIGQDIAARKMSEVNYRIYRAQITDPDLQKELEKAKDTVTAIVSVKPNTEKNVIEKIASGTALNASITGSAISDGTKSVEILTNFTSGGFVKKINATKKDERGHFIEEDELISQGDVVRLEPNRKSYLKEDDIIFPSKTIEMEQVWKDYVFNNGEYIFDGEGETICVIDSGINFNFPDIKERAALSCNILCNENDCKEDCSQADAYGHGTKVASILGATSEAWNYKGVSFGSKIISVKVFKDGEEAVTDLIRQIKAINWCVDNSKKYNISVISMSIGGKQYENLCDSSDVAIKNAVFRAFENKIAFVASAGNEGFKNKICAPSCISKSISVGMTYQTNYEKNEVQCFNQLCTDNCTDITPKKDDVVCSSNRNANITKIFAPGYDIFTLSKDGNYYLSTGTSMATPIVSGSIAVINQVLKSNKVKIKDKYKNMNPKDIEQLLWTTGAKVTDKETNAQYSRININNAVKEIVESFTPEKQTQIKTPSTTKETQKSVTTTTPTTKKITYQQKTGIVGFFDNIITKIKSLFS